MASFAVYTSFLFAGFFFWLAKATVSASRFVFADVFRVAEAIVICASHWVGNIWLTFEVHIVE